MERDGDNDEEQDEEKQDKEEQYKEEEDKKEEDGNEEEDEDEDDGKEPRTIVLGEMVNTSPQDVHTMEVHQPMAWPEQDGEAREDHMATTSGACLTATNPRATLTTMNYGDSSPLWAVVFGVCDDTKTLPDSANSARSFGSRKHLGCGCGSAAALRIGWWRHSPQSPTPRYPSCTGAPRWLGRQGINQWLQYREGNCCCVRVRVGFLSCSFPFF